MRLVIRPVLSDKEIVIENLSGNEGLEMQFQVKRSINETTSSGSVTIFNLPRSLRGLVEGEARRIGNIDDLIEDGTLWSVGLLDEIGAPATPANQGYATIEIQAGYDGALSTIFFGTMLHSETRDDTITVETVINASSGISQVALSQANQSFDRGTDSFVVLNYLRRVLKLGPGNCTPENWSKFLADAAGVRNRAGQTVFTQASVLAAPYVVTDAADQQLDDFLKYTGVRWFIDEGELWLLPRLGYIEGPVARLEPLKERPARNDAGLLVCRCFLTAAVKPGRQVLLDGTGVDDAVTALYRCDVAEHDGDTNASGEYSTTVTLSQRRPVPGGLL